MGMKSLKNRIVSLKNAFSQPVKQLNEISLRGQKACKNRQDRVREILAKHFQILGFEYIF